MEKIEVIEQTCTKCKVTRPASMFYRCAAQPTGIEKVCIPCRWGEPESPEWLARIEKIEKKATKPEKPVEPVTSPEPESEPTKKKPARVPVNKDATGSRKKTAHVEKSTVKSQSRPAKKK